MYGKTFISIMTSQSKLLVTKFQFNVFSFGAMLFVQIIGIAMGTRAAPTIANTFMGVIDKLIRHCPRTFRPHLSTQCDPILLFKRFIDVIFLLWTGTLGEFNAFLIEINQLHPNIKFTASFDFEKKSTTFLDTVITIVD